MQIHTAASIHPTPKDPSLYTLVNELIHESAPLAVHNRNYIVNNVPADLSIETNDSMISSVLNKLFQTVIRHTQNSVILVSAKVYGMTILVQLKSRGTISPGLPEEIVQVGIKAKKSGGIIEMVHCETEQAAVAYCFLNVAGAA